LNKTAYIIGVRISSLLRHTLLCSRIKAYISIKKICTVRAFISAPKNSKLVSPFSIISLSPPQTVLSLISNKMPTVKSGLFPNNCFLFYWYPCSSTTIFVNQALKHKCSHVCEYIKLFGGNFCHEQESMLAPCFILCVHHSTLQHVIVVVSHK
jgi:hypothetical protein